jgi:hypothetical protein
VDSAASARHRRGRHQYRRWTHGAGCRPGTLDLSNDLVNAILLKTGQQLRIVLGNLALEGGAT